MINNGTKSTTKNLKSKNSGQVRPNNGSAKKNKKKVNGNGSLAGQQSPLRFAPVSKTRVVSTARPKMTTLSNGDCRVIHREYIQDVLGSILFTNTQLAINPGQEDVFPWLSKIARNYESYRFRKLHFYFETEAATSATGSLILSVDYDASDSAPTTKQQAMTYRNSVRTAPWSSCCHSSLEKDLHKALSNYVRPGGQPSNTDIKQYDVGNLNVSTIGQVDAATIGELYVEYDVDFITPQYESDTVYGGSFTAGGTINAANPLGNAPVSDTSNRGISLSTNSLLTFTRNGDYVLTYRFVGTVITAAPSALTLGAGVTVISSTLGVIDGGALNCIVTTGIRVNLSAGAGTVDITLTATSVTSGRLDVAIVPTNSIS